MNALQQKCRPKHQVLVLKCYPRTTKGAVDVKPNSSELSYLLFYATSRRSKIQKVGSFLEKKTASDVWRLRIGNVQVTLQILAGLIEKAPKDLPLFAPNVLKILELVLRSNDITMVEASLPTFETFCEHQDASSLFADQAYVRQYEEIVRSYATFASTQQTSGKGASSKPVAARWRNAGLEAIKSVADSEALSSVAGRQLDVIVPMILENLWTDNEDNLELLLKRAQVNEKVDGSNHMHRRTSVSTVPGEDGDANPLAMSGSAADADKIAEEETGVMAMQCLKQIFVIPNRAQMNGATTALLRFIREKVQQEEAVVKTSSTDSHDSGWGIKIFGLVTSWAPVQDRYVILLTAMESLLRTQPTDENVPEHIVLVAMIGSLLRSDVNLIGLSVMDVLLGLVQHMKRVLKYSGRSSQASQNETPKTSSTNEKPPLSAAQPAQTMTPHHRELLDRIQQCIGDLATHVYYADQISDMIQAILLRLKPHPSMTNPTPPGEKTDTAPGTSTGNLSEDQNQLDSFFALDLAKTAALKAIKIILLVANPKTKITGNVSLTRNKVPIQTWEGTHWLLRDPHGQVRKAYADAIITWLDRETTTADLRARDDGIRKPKGAGAKEVQSPSFARRAVSNASNREKPNKTPQSHFLQLLHLAIYDNALQYVEYETDIALCHVLLAKLVSKLGANAARYGLPMVFRLQEDIQEADTPVHKVRLGSLCHGYFWALTERFDFDASNVGRAVQNEVVRRRSKSFWVEGVTVPPPMLELVGTPGMPRPQPRMPIKEIESEALLPFDDRLAMVDFICTNYQESATSPPVSPSTSPSRQFSHPIFSSTLSAIPPAEADHELPIKFREDMLAEWTREAVVASLAEGSKSASLNGSRAGTTHTKGNRLTVNGHVNGGGATPTYSQNNLRPVSHAGASVKAGTALRKSSMQSHVSGVSDSSRGFVASVDQLKSVLAGDVPRPGTLHTVQDDDSSESMASYDYPASEISFNPAQGDGPNQTEASTRSRSKSHERKGSDPGGPLGSHPPAHESQEMNGEEEVPPVPPLPTSISGQPTTSINRPMSGVSARDHAPKGARRNLKSRGGDSMLSSSLSEAGSGALDLQSLLKGIDSKSKEHTLGNLTRPPY